MKLVFATNNLHKFIEIKELISNDIELLSLRDLNFHDEIPEDYDTLEENASQKAWYIYNKYKINCFADDTGLEVEYLNGKPGVLSARYAGEAKNPQDNIIKLLHELKGINNRKARFRTVISLIINGNETRFEGIVNGTIIEELKGNKGFGYDPVFVPEGYDITFAEMPLDEKNKISHRALAFKQLAQALSLKQSGYNNPE